jgi:hypothetical protein
MKYTWDQIFEFLMIYEDKNYSNMNDFVKKMKDFNVSEKESSLIWQIFDVAEFYYWQPTNEPKQHPIK